MKSIEKLPWLASLELQTEEFIHNAVGQLQNLDEDILTKPARNGGWSITQCLEHLNTYGDYYLPRLQSGIYEYAMLDSADSYTSSWIGTYLIRLIDPEKSTIKLKAVKRHQPAGTLPAYQLMAEFIDQQETMLQLLRKAQDVDVNHHKIPLSVAPWLRLPLGDILYFMVVHTRRHVIQANRNLQDPIM